MNNPAPLVSVILPTYNVAPWLEDCLHSLRGQSLQEWEAIFVIDGGTDDSQSIVERAAQTDNRICMIAQENQGQGAARNLGVTHARGKYLFFLDPDDVLPQNALECAVSAAEETGADIVIGDYSPFLDGERSEWGNKAASDEFSEKFKNLPRLFGRSDIEDHLFFYHSLYFMVVWMKLFRTSVWKSHEIAAPVGISMGEDFMTVKKMFFLTNKTSITPHTLIYYRKRPGSSTTLRSRKALGIFTSYQYTAKMYQDMNLSNKENVLMHQAYLAWFFFHMIKFTPLRFCLEFYQETCRCVSNWQIDDLGEDSFKPSEKMAITLLKKNSILYFPLYVLVMLRVDNMAKAAIVMALQFMNRALPKSITVRLAGLVDQMAKRTHSPGLKSLLQKSKLHLLGRDE